MSTPRRLTADEVVFTIKLHPCDLDVFEELSECGTRAEIQAVIDLADGDWGWCDVEVVATWGIWSASDYLGGCSYESEADFTGPSGSDYYADMKTTALANLNDEIAGAYAKLAGLAVMA